MKTTAKLLPLLLLVAFTSAAAAPPVPIESRSPADCEALVAGSHPADNSVLTLLKSYSEGAIPNLQDSEQATLFEIYRYLYFGDPTTQLAPESMSELVKAVRSHPEVSKTRFSSGRVRSLSTLKLPDLISRLIQQTKQNAQISNGKMYKVSANSGFWNKIFAQMPEPPRDNAGFLSRLSTPVARQFAHATGGIWKRFLPDELVGELEREDLPGEKKAELLFNQLNSLRAHAPDYKPLAQTLADIAHSAPFLNADDVSLLKADDGKVAMDAFELILGKRDRFAQSVGFGSFEKLIAELGIKQPSSLSLPNGKFVSQWEQMKNESLEKWMAEAGQDEFLVRQLSLVEAYFRSCVGGNECSSRTYGTKALDPNYHYFTMTDSDGRSSGHLTIVLGTGTVGGESKKVAFVDKLQNVALEKIPLLLDGARRSLLEKGYLMAAPKELGDQDGLSNTAETRTYMATYVPLDSALRVEAFAPHPHEFNFANRYSRAENGLDIFFIGSLSTNRYSLSLEETPPFRTAEPLNLRLVAQESYALKHGSERDMIVYVKTQEALKPLGLRDPAYSQWAASRLDAQETYFSVKKQIVLSGDPAQIFSLAETHLSETEKARFFTSVVSSPFYRKWIGLDRIYLFLESHPQHLKQISSRNFSSFSLQRLLKLGAERVFAAALKSNAINLEKPHKKTGGSTLGKAASLGNLAAVRTLIKEGAQLEAVDDRGRTPLMRAVINGHRDAIQMLLEANANPSAVSLNGMTPLMEAAKNGDRGTAQLLLIYGASKAELSPNLHSPAYFARKFGHRFLAEELDLAP